MEKRKVRFTEKCILPRVGKPDLVYEEGSAHDLRVDRAQRWIKRGKAVLVTESEAAAQAAPKAIEIPTAEYDRVAAQIAAGDFELAFAAPQMAEHYKVDAKVIRGELETRIEKLKGSTDGNAVGGAANVAGQDGGGAGVGTEHVAGGGRGGARGRRSGGGGQSHA